MSQSSISKILETCARHTKDTGSPEVQVTVASYKILKLAKHMKVFPKDHSTRRGLLAIVNQRKSMLRYYNRINPEETQVLMKTLKIKKI
jgi:small subunit ribosomal protein S15